MFYSSAIFNVSIKSEHDYLDSHNIKSHLLLICSFNLCVCVRIVYVCVVYVCVVHVCLCAPVCVFIPKTISVRICGNL